MYKRILSFGFLLCFNLLFSNPTIDKYSDLIKRGNKAKLEKRYIQALEYYTKASLIAEENKWYEKDLIVKNSIGLIYSKMSNYGEALNYYNQAISITEKSPKLFEKRAYMYINIGVLYNKEDAKTALLYFKKAYKIVHQDGSDYLKKAIAINIADCYNKLNQLESAGEILEQVQDEIGDFRLDKAWKITYAENLLLRGEITEAKYIAENLFPTINHERDGECYVCIIELLFKIYKQEQQIDKAVEYINKGLTFPLELHDRIMLLNELSDLYKIKKEYHTSSKYKDSVIRLKDSLATVVNQNLYESNKVKLKVKEYESELEIRKEKFRSERFFYILILIFGLVLIFLIYKGLRSKILKQRQEKEIAKKQQRIIELQVDNLNNNIAEKNRKISAKALFMSGRNELIKEVTESLLQIPKISENQYVLGYLLSLKNHLRTESEWDDFIEHFKEVNPELLAVLEEKHPNLSSTDIRFICYLYMNISIKEISTILNITYNACKIRKRRILEKMGLQKDISLYDYIREITFGV